MALNYPTTDRIDAAGNPNGRFALIPFEDIEDNNWDCCRERDESDGAEPAVPDETALVPVVHWYEHELREATNQQLADILVSGSLTAGARQPDGTFPQSSQLDLESGKLRQGSAKTILHERGLSEDQIAQIQSGRFWPED